MSQGLAQGLPCTEVFGPSLEPLLRLARIILTSQSPHQTEKSGLRRSNVPAQKFTKCVLSRLSLQKIFIVGSVFGPTQSGRFGPGRAQYSLNKSSKIQALPKKLEAVASFVCLHKN